MWEIPIKEDRTPLYPKKEKEKGSRLSCPILNQYGHCKKSKECEGCNKQ